MSYSLAHRKAAQKICFTDKAGKILSDVSVKVKLVNHKFLFGSGAFDSLPATSEVDMGKIDFYHGDKMPAKEFFGESRPILLETASIIW